MIYVCKKCEATYDSENEEFPPDQNSEGYWCDCEFYNYFDSTKERPPFLLFLETSAARESAAKLKHKVKLKKQLSPLRYPG
ncbi:DNA adenine methylase, partial [Bacillus subtilis]